MPQPLTGSPRATTVEMPLEVQGIATPVDSIAGTSADEVPRLPRGTVIGEFTVVRPLGRGGSGLVYEALQASPRRSVALKLLGGFLTDSAWRRFRYEAEVLARLRHPGIAHVYGSGMADVSGGTAWIAMELVTGGVPITTYAASGDLHEESRIELFARVCDAVAHAHGRGVIHRDIKPGNILVDDSATARLIDFGIAMPLKDDGPRALSATLLAAGTPQYMSPEQFSLDPVDLDVRTDIYSLGLVLYELVGGRRPYEIGSCLMEAARTVTSRPPATLPRSVPGPLRRVIAKTLEKDRERRYDSAAELASDLRRFLAGDAVLAAPAGLGESLLRLARRHRAASIAAAATATVVMAAAVAVASFALEATRQRNEARRQLTEAEAARSRAEKSTAFMLDTLAALDPGYEGPSLNTADVLLKIAAKANAAGDEPTRAAVLESIGRGLIATGRRPDAAKLLDEAVALRGRLDGEDALTTREAIASARFAHMVNGNREAAAGLWERELTWHRRNRKTNFASTASFLYRMADWLSSERASEARVLEIAREALAAGERAAATHAAGVSNRLAYARILERLRQDETVSREVEAAVTTVEDGGGMSDDERIAILHSAAWLLRRIDTSRCILLHQAAVDAAVAAFGPDDRRTLASRQRHAAAHGYAAGQAGAQLELLEALVADWRRVVGPDDTDTIAATCELAAALGRLEKHMAAAAAWREVFDRRRRLLGPDHLVTITSALRLSSSLTNIGRRDEARSLVNDVLVRRTRLLGEEHTAVIEARRLVERIGLARPMALPQASPD